MCLSDDATTGIRQHLHALLELSFEERKRRFAADKLEGWGDELTRNVGSHGVVAQHWQSSAPD